MTDELTRTFSVPAVRDLAWAIGSPGLLDPGDSSYCGQLLDDAFCAARLTETSAWLRALDHDPQPLHVFIEARHSHRLGHYFENLIEFWLQHAGVKDLRTRLQAGETGRAVGEFDFVFRQDDWGGWLHWEAAVKFYLQHTPAPTWDAFIGPNPADRLSDKLHKLFDKQLKLGETAAGRALLGLDNAPVPRAFVKGYLFFPVDTAPPAIPGISAHCLKGWWLRHGERPLPAHHRDARWKVLHRLSWLAPARATAEEMKLIFDTTYMNTVIARHFARSHTPLLLAELTPDEDGVWNEVARGFVVSPRWPREPTT